MTGRSEIRFSEQKCGSPKIRLNKTENRVTILKIRLCTNLFSKGDVK
jgi:hypothetical protein